MGPTAAMPMGAGPGAGATGGAWPCGTATMARVPSGFCMTMVTSCCCCGGGGAAPKCGGPA